jgi:hypothetical protein
VTDKPAEARNALSAAIDRRADLKTRVETANKAKARGETLVQRSHAKLARLDVEAEQAAEQQAAAIREGEDVTLPTALAGRGTAESELKLAISALDILTREFELAQRAYQGANVSVREAAARLITLEAEVLADELVAHRERAAQLHDCLLGLTYVGVSALGKFHPWPLTPKLSSALNWAVPQHTAHTDPIKTNTTRWTSYRNALVDDPEAVLEPRVGLHKASLPLIRSVA